MSFPSVMILQVLQGVSNYFSRGINEGRQCAREVDAFLMGTSSQLPVTGGIVRRPAIDTVPQTAGPISAA